MRELLRPVLNRNLYRGWFLAYLGSALGLPALVAALAAALPPWPAGMRVCAAILGFGTALCIMALPRATRRGLVFLAGRLLDVELAPPVEPPLTRRADTARTAAWLGAHILTGWLVTAVTGFCLLAAAVFPGVWLGGGDGAAELLGLRVPIAPGWRGAWTPALSLAFLLAAGCVAALAVAALRRLAPVLLGPSPAERLAEAEVRLTALTRRQMIAQELHDSIGHTLTASTIQAAVALELMDRDPDEARRALRSIEETSRAAMDDLDHVLGALREQPAPRRPRRTLAELDSLVERVREAGADISVETAGDVGRIPATVSAEAYRIIRESLTNVLRHGEKDDVRLSVAVADGWLEISVTNRVGTRPSGGRRGQGLAGLRERTRLLGGELSAGPDGDSLWRVSARVPLRSWS